MKLTSDQISDIPYVLFINDKGQGWTLNRQYKLQYHNIGGWKGIKRYLVPALIPHAMKVEQGYPLFDPEAIPSWINKYKVAKAGHSFKTYWFNQHSEDVQKAFHDHEFSEGVTYHFDRVGDITNELKIRKAEQRAEITKQYRKEFGIRKPFLSDGMIRFYLHGKDQEFLTQWNDRWWTNEVFTKKELDLVISSIKEFLHRENATGTFHISLEGQYQACTSFQEAEEGWYEPWNDYFQVDYVATIVIK